MITLPKIQYITRDDNEISHSEQARLMFANGVNWVQLRMKNSSKQEILTEAFKAREHADIYGGKLIINDSISIAQEINAAGVHLGLNDLEIDEARKIIGDNFIIGGTANTFDDVIMQHKRGADYIGLGPFRFTKTKEKLSPVIGVSGYRKIIEQLKAHNIHVPVTAVGGITMDDIDEILTTNINGVAISGALLDHYKLKKVHT